MDEVARDDVRHWLQLSTALVLSGAADAYREALVANIHRLVPPGAAAVCPDTIPWTAACP